MCIGVFSISSLGPYLTIYYVFHGNEKAASVLVGWTGTAWAITGISLMFAVSWVGTRFGKRRTLMAGMVIALFGNLIKWFCYSPTHPWLVVIPSIFIAVGFCTLWPLSGAMMADVCDYHEFETGVRREGAIQAVSGWIMKVGTTIAFAMSGFVLNIAGFNNALGGNQAPQTLLLMRLMDVGVPSVSILAALYLLERFPLTERRVHEIRAELETRRGALRAATQNPAGNSIKPELAEDGI
jgi:GPH family glycoside/pentoside/hexuronide:cation symporter